LPIVFHRKIHTQTKKKKACEQKAANKMLIKLNPVKSSLELFCAFPEIPHPCNHLQHMAVIWPFKRSNHPNLALLKQFARNNMIWQVGHF